jgi:hypothetical protein
MRSPRILSVVTLVLVSRAAWPQGDPLGPEFRVNTYLTGPQSQASVAADPAGNFVIVWHSEQEAGPNHGVFGQRYASSGVPLGPQFHVNTYTTLNQVYPSVAAAPSGDFVVVWVSWQDGSGYGVFGRRFGSSGAPLTNEFRVNTYTTSAQLYPSVATDGSGNFIVVWASQDGSGLGIAGQRYASSGAPLGSEFRINTFTTDNQLTPALAADAAGNFVVVWTSQFQDELYGGIFGQRYASSGAPLGPEFRVNTSTMNDQYGPAVASDPTGSFVVAWAGKYQDGSDGGIFAQRYVSSGAPIGAEFRVNTYTTNNQGSPSVAADSAGNFVVVWQSLTQDGSGEGVFGQRYASSGAPLGSEFQVNSYTTNSQLSSSVASDPGGDFVIAWSSTFQDGSSLGVFGQRYNMILPVELMHFRVE